MGIEVLMKPKSMLIKRQVKGWEIVIRGGGVSQVETFLRWSSPSELQKCISSCLLSISTWISNRILDFPLPHQPISLPRFPISVIGTTQLKPKTWVILDSSLSLSQPAHQLVLSVFLPSCILYPSAFLHLPCHQSSPEQAYLSP